MKILLFGATGFIGRHVVSALGSEVEVIPVSRRGAIRHDLVADGPEALVALLDAVAPDVVVNCAGLLAGTLAHLVEANITATARLIDACSGLSRLVTLGSAAEYGIVATGIPVAESADCRPVGAYGVTRLAATSLLRLAVEEGRLDGVALRVFNPVGAGLPAENVLGRTLRQLDAGVPEIRLGPLGAYRDFVDVRDVGRAVALAATAATLTEPVLNVGSGVAVPTREPVRMLCEAAGFTGRLTEADPVPSRSAGVDWIAADLTLIDKALGWRPERSLAETMASASGR